MRTAERRENSGGDFVVSSMTATMPPAPLQEKHENRELLALFALGNGFRGPTHRSSGDPANVLPHPIGAKLSVGPRHQAYIPHFEDAIWREFPPLVWRAVRLVRDAEQGEDLSLQVGELGVEDLDSTLAAHERVPLGQTEQVQDLFGGRSFA